MSLKNEISERLGFFLGHGMLHTLPTPWQIRVGSLAMLPLYLSESERERERSRGTWLGQVPLRVPLQVLYCPQQSLSATGLGMAPRHLVQHLLSVYHEDAFLGYDLQLLQSHPEGLGQLRREARRIAEGRGRGAILLQRLVGQPGYHRGLERLAEAAMDFCYPDPEDLDPCFVTLTGFAAFCSRLPRWPAPEFYGFDLGRIRRKAE
jgi:hypothetical protein